MPTPLAAGIVAAALALLMTGVVAILAGYQTLPELTTLQVELADREVALTPRAAVFGLPLLGLAILGLNLTLTAVLRGREPALSVLLCGTACLVQLVILLATLRVFS